MQANEAPRAISVVVFAVVAVLGIFFLPLTVHPRPTVSEAYLYGFSNRAAQAVFLGCAVFFGWWVRRWGLRFPDSFETGAPCDRRPFLLALSVTVVAVAIVWIGNRAGGAFDDAVYALTRLQEHAAGERLYRDFEYAYGPLLFYAPLLLAKLRFFPIVDAFYALWAVEWVIGIVLLRGVVYGTMPRPYASTAFLWLTSFTLVALLPTSAMTYSPVRYLLGPALALNISRRYRERQPVALTASLIAGGTILLLTLWPEQGIAFFCATILYFVVCAKEHRKPYLIALSLSAAVFAASILLLYRMGAFTTFLHMGGGALNFPILLCPAQLGVFALLMVAAAGVVTAARTRSLNHPLVYLCAIALFLVPAAYGRCDIGHVVMNMIPAIVAGFAVLSRSPKGRLTVTLLFGVAVLLPNSIAEARLTRGVVTNPISTWAYHIELRHPRLQAIAERVLPHMLGRRRFNTFMAALEQLNHQQLRPVPAGVVLDAPFSYDPPAKPDPTLPVVRTGHFNAMENLVTPDDLQMKIRELNQHPERPLLLSKDWRNSCRLDDGTLPLLLKVQYAPVYLPPLKHPDTLFSPLCHFIETAYHPFGPSPFAGFELWIRNGQPAVHP